MVENIIKILGAVGFGAIVVGVTTATVNYLLGKRRAAVDDRDAAVREFEALVSGSSDIIVQLREQVDYLFKAHRRCEQTNVQLRQQNLELAADVGRLRRRIERLEGNGNG